ncbi:MAG TPA: 50S ribosomal protein L5 [archaeon]|nr:50S ribosomal protein L5 [archaeon]HLD81019.1 50S ribosomal protein L5 [archaeon]
MGAGTENNMNQVKLEKVVLNIGAGEAGQKVNNAAKLLELVSGAKATKTQAKVKIVKWEIREGLEIGAKVTLRKKAASDMLVRALEAVDKTLKPSSISSNGNLAFGIKEYINIKGVNYDPDIGMFGMDVCVKLSRAGERIARRRQKPSRFPEGSKITKDEAIEFLKQNYQVRFEE